MTVIKDAGGLLECWPKRCELKGTKKRNEGKKTEEMRMWNFYIQPRTVVPPGGRVVSFIVVRFIHALNSTFNFRLH